MLISGETRVKRTVESASPHVIKNGLPNTSSPSEFTWPTHNLHFWWPPPTPILRYPVYSTLLKWKYSITNLYHGLIINHQNHTILIFFNHKLFKIKNSENKIQCTISLKICNLTSYYLGQLIGALFCRFFLHFSQKQTQLTHPY